MCFIAVPSDSNGLFVFKSTFKRSGFHPKVVSRRFVSLNLFSRKGSAWSTGRDGVARFLECVEIGEIFLRCSAHPVRTQYLSIKNRDRTTFPFTVPRKKAKSNNCAAQRSMNSASPRVVCSRSKRTFFPSNISESTT